MGSKIGFILVLIIIGASFVGAITLAKLLISPSIDEYTMQAQKDFDQAKKEIEQIRNVTLPKVDLVVVTKQWAIDTWGTGFAQPDLTNILREEKVYKSLFMMPENASLYQANVDWAGNFGAASWNGKIYVVQENFNPFIQPDATATFVHELTHVMQGQFQRPQVPSNFDSNKATDALNEGDASFMGDYYKNLTRTQASPAIAAIDQVPSFLLGDGLLGAVHPELHNVVSDLNWFPYTFGTLYIDALHKKSGWATVNQAYANPPTTTEQIIHPDKYFLNETAQQVAMPTLAESGWNQVRNDRYGEYFIQNMLGNWLNQKEALTAAAGWGGDNFTYYEKGSDYLFTWNIKWDSGCDASEFYIAFNNMLNATGTQKENCIWLANGRYISITWNQDQNSTLIASSSNETVMLSPIFT